MTLSVDLFFSFRSPYSYLALPKTLKLVANYDVTVTLRPVYPLAVRVPGFFKRANPQFARYVVLDSSRAIGVTQAGLWQRALWKPRTPDTRGAPFAGSESEA
jgi:2-hydroxychromene-2-carboxylate isomerase